MDNLIFFNKKDAMKRLKKDKSVKYYNNTDQQIKELEDKKFMLIHKDYISRKNFVKCRQCKSKINTLYTRLNFKYTHGIETSEHLCPICKFDLRKPKILKKQTLLVNKILKLKTEKKLIKIAL